ncbi:MAG: RIP metalloprotease RseP [Gammaproteobacteria bacterium]
MFSVIISIIAVILVVFILIGVHEAGHFVTARLCGIKVLRFSLGFGKPIFQFSDKHGTEYVLSVLPLGGYVELLDEHGQQAVPSDQVHLSFNRQVFWKRFIVIAAGPVFNLLLAIVLFWGVFLVGFKVPIPVIGEIIPGSPAAKAQMTAQQIITSVDHNDVSDWRAVVFELIEHIGNNDAVQLTTQTYPDRQDTKKVEIDLHDWKIDPLKPDILQSLGIVPQPPQQDGYVMVKKSIFPAGVAALQETWLYIDLNVLTLYKVIVGKISLQSLGGPITIFQGAIVSFNQGLVNYLSFMAIVSIILAIVNVIPIPGLDGAQMLYLLIEKFRGKPLSLEVQALIFRLGMIAIALLFVLVIINDVKRLTMV